jgi:hypothetical protein
MTICSEVVAYLAALGADTVPHSGRNLLAHLKATAELVAAWGLPRYVILAALFHSVYGTEYFRRETLSSDNREILRQRIGSMAERLVFLFHSLSRASLFTGQGASGLRWINADDLKVTPDEFQCSAHIGVANIIEPHWKKGFLSRCRLMRTRRHWENVERYLSPQANAHIARVYTENHGAVANSRAREFLAALCRWCSTNEGSCRAQRTIRQRK